MHYSTKLIAATIICSIFCFIFFLNSNSNALVRDFFVFSIESGGQNWTNDEKQNISELLQRAKKLSPSLLEKASIAGPVKLLRQREITVNDDNYGNSDAYAISRRGSVSFCNDFFVLTEKEKLIIVLHELTHLADVLHEVAFSPEMLEYYKKNHKPSRVEQIGLFDLENDDIDDDSVIDVLANAYPKYVMSLKLPDNDFFRGKVAKRFEQTSNSLSLASRHFVNAKKLLSENKLEEGRREILQVLKVLPESIEAGETLTATLCAMKNHEEAYRQSTDVLQRMNLLGLPQTEPKRLDLYKWRATALFFLGQYQESKNLFQLILKSRPKNQYCLTMLEALNRRLQ